MSRQRSLTVKGIHKHLKHKLPDEYDVFITQTFLDPLQDLIVPGNVYAATFIDVGNIDVKGDFFADDCVDCGDLKVEGDCIVKGMIDCLDVTIGGLFVCEDVLSWDNSITAQDFECTAFEE